MKKIDYILMGIWVVFSVWILISSYKQSEIRIREHFDLRFDSLIVIKRAVPKLLYDRTKDECVLVYPDTMFYVKPESIYGIKNEANNYSK